MSNATQTQAAELYIRLLRGETIPGAELLIKFGENTDIDTGTDPEDVWRGGGLYTFPTTAQTMVVASSDAADAAAGTGLQTLRVEGLDANYAEVSEDVSMTANPGSSTTTTEFLRVFRAYGVSFGSGETNAGNITLTGSSSAAVHAYVAAGAGQTQLALWTVPAGKRFSMQHFDASCYRDAAGSANGQAIFELRTRDNALANPGWRVRYSTARQVAGSGAESVKAPPAYNFPEKTDIVVQIREVTQDNMGCTATFAGIVVDTSYDFS